MVNVMRKRLQAACLAIVMVLSAGGCAGAPSGVFPADQTSGQRQAEAAMQEAKTESAALRAELASARIAAAKQEAELRELRQAVDAKHAELIELRNERGRLAQTATIAQVGIADPSALPASAADVAGLQVRLHEVESALAALTAELAQVRKDVSQSVPVSKSKPAAPRPAGPRSP